MVALEISKAISIHPLGTRNVYTIHPLFVEILGDQSCAC